MIGSNLNLFDEYLNIMTIFLNPEESYMLLEIINNI